MLELESREMPKVSLFPPTPPLPPPDPPDPPPPLLWRSMAASMPLGSRGPEASIPVSLRFSSVFTPTAAVQQGWRTLSKWERALWAWIWSEAAAMLWNDQQLYGSDTWDWNRFDLCNPWLGIIHHYSCCLLFFSCEKNDARTYFNHLLKYLPQINLRNFLRNLQHWESTGTNHAVGTINYYIF